MGFFLRPKDTNKNADGSLKAESIELADGAQERFTQRHPSDAREARKDAPLPTGSWRGGKAARGRVGGRSK